MGPQRQPSIHGSTQVAASIFDPYPGPEVDAAKTIIKSYMGMLGWPQSVDTEQMALELLQNNLENKAQDAYEHLWNSSFLTDDMRKANPWARFGQDADTFHQNLTATQDTIRRLTGMNVSLGDMLAPKPDPVTGAVNPTDPMSALLQNALKGGWTQQQILDSLQAGSFTSLGGEKTDLTGITAAEPWLLAGQTYQQQAQQFHTIYGAAPVDTAQLAGWYRFNQQAATMGPWYARQAIVGAPGKVPTAVSQPEVR